MANKGSDGQSMFQWTTHFSCITRVHLWAKMIGDPKSGTERLAKVVRLAKSAGGELQGQVVKSAFKALATAQTKKTGNARADIIVLYVRDCWGRGSILGGHGGQKMWDFDYLLRFTQRPASSFCDDPRAQEILARAKYQHGPDHGASSHNGDVSEFVSEFNSATPGFVKLLMTKIDRGIDTQFKAGQSGNVDTQFKAGQSGNVATQFKACGRFGLKGNAQTYASAPKLAKAIGIGDAGLLKALTRAKKKTPSSALRVDFKCAGFELFWDKESTVGESAVEEEKEEEAP
jgi:hypothetical protein